MARVAASLSTTELNNLKSEDKRYQKGLGDGLFIFVEPSGKKYFTYIYKSPITKKVKKYKIGNFPTISLKEAKKRRFELEQQVEAGDDLVNNSNTNYLENVAKEWFEIKRKNGVTEEYLKREWRNLEMYIFPTLGKMPINNIKSNNIISILKIVEKKGIYETVSRILGTLRQIFRYASTNNKAAYSVVGDINASYTFIKGKERNFPTITDTKTIKLLIEGINEYSGEFATRNALKLIMLTAQRPFNIRAAQWSEFDLDEGTWTIHPDKMKMRKEHKLALSTQAVELLREHRKFYSDSRYLFPSMVSKEKCMSDATLNLALRRMGFSKDEMVAHGFRAMFSTLCYENRTAHGVDTEIIEQCLAHSQSNKVKAAYDRSSNLELKRVLMQWWADFLMNI